MCLIIRDGWGKGEDNDTNAIFTAHTPFADRIERDSPTALIDTSGESVGLPAGYQGNSEVGHLNIGAGRIVYQNLTRIDHAIQNGDFYQNEVLNRAIQQAKETGATVHLVGLIQEEGIHAVTRHGLAILRICKKIGHPRVLIHGISDGRDTPPKSARQHFDFLQAGIDKLRIGRIASIAGRYYAMDRDRRWDRTEKYYRCLVQGMGEKVRDYPTAIRLSYQRGITDEFIQPFVIDYQGVNRDDVIIFFNFRFDRTRQITRAIVEKDFDQFKVIDHNLTFVAMTHYYDHGNFREVFPQQNHKNLLGEVLSRQNLIQLRCSETEKYAHVTFFFNGLKNDPFPGEERILVKSPSVPTYDQKPEMSAFEIRDKILQALGKDRYHVIIINFANGDMVGHTGVFDCIVKAVETVDQCCRDITRAVLDRNGTVIITADHGNAEATKLQDGSPMTSHSKNPVPLTVVAPRPLRIKSRGKLCDIAPTMLELLGIAQPEEMTGESLLIGSEAP